jgi:response regulator of citrate/malate metabolism
MLVEIEQLMLERTVDDLVHSLELLTKERDALNQRISESQGRVDALKLKLAQAGRSSGNKKGRRRKGESDRAIAELLASNPDKGFTLSEIAEQTEIPVTSAQRALKRAGDKFETGSDNLWRVKKVK